MQSGLLGKWGAFPRCKASLHTHADVPALLPQLRPCPHTTCHAPEAGRKGAPSSEKGKPAASPTPPAARGKSRRVGPTSTSLVATASITLSPSTRGDPNTAAHINTLLQKE